MVADTIRTRKASIRKAILAQRELLTSADRQRRSTRITEQLFAVIQEQKPDVIGLFVSLPDEVQLQALILKLASCRCPILLPAYDGAARSYRYRLWQRGAPLLPGRWDIPEPQGRDYCDPHGRCLLLVPGLAFDRHGNRIGYGAGFFDRMLASAHKTAESVFAVGVAFPFQVLEDLPHEPHDQFLDAVATGEDWIECQHEQIVGGADHGV